MKFKNPLSGIWKTFSEKGRWTTFLSLVIAFPINVSGMIQYFNDPDWFTESRILVLAVLNGIAWFWAIMPSRLVAKGPAWEVTIED